MLLHTGTYCGKKKNVTMTSSGHIMNILFSANENNRGKGFNATYKVIDSGEFIKNIYFEKYIKTLFQHVVER